MAGLLRMILFGHLTPWALLVFLSVKKPVMAITVFQKKLSHHVMPAMKNTAVTNTLFGLLLGIGILIGHLPLINNKKPETSIYVDASGFFVFVCLDGSK